MKVVAENTTTVAELLDADAFSAAFDSVIEAGEAPPEKPEEKLEEKPEEKPEEKLEEKPEEKPAAAPVDVAQLISDAVKAATAKPEAPAEVVVEAETESPEVIAALADLEENWGTHAVAVNALLDRQAKKLKEEFSEILKPLQAQMAPMLAATAENEQARFNTEILAAHADGFTIIPAVEAWIETQPEYLRPAYNHVLDNGSAAEVNKFLSDYKKATGAVVPDTSAADKAAAEAAAAAAKKLKKMEAPVTTRTSVTAELDPTDFESAFDAGAKNLTM